MLDQDRLGYIKLYLVRPGSVKLIQVNSG